MSKLTPIEKVQAVKLYLEGTESQDSVAKRVGVSKAMLLTWIRQYEHHGELSFMKGYTSYTADYKLMVLQYIAEHGTSLREAAAIFNIPTHSLLSRWRKELESGGVDALKPMKKGRPTMKEEKKPSPPEGSTEALQAEIERLRMENAYLKKLNALVQSKEKLRSKTKRK